MASALEYVERDRLFALRVHLLVSAVAVVASAGVALWSRWLRSCALVVLLLAVVNIVVVLRRITRLSQRLMATLQFSEAMINGDRAQAETAWLTMMYLAAPATEEEPWWRRQLRQQSGHRTRSGGRHDH